MPKCALDFACHAPLLGQRAGEEEEILPAIAFNEAVALFAADGWWPNGMLLITQMAKKTIIDIIGDIVEILVKITIIGDPIGNDKALEWKKWFEV